MTYYLEPVPVDWTRYDACGKCNQPAGEPCIDLRSTRGRYSPNRPHIGRKVKRA